MQKPGVKRSLVFVQELARANSIHPRTLRRLLSNNRTAKIFYAGRLASE
jgi:hypothetical protein